LVSSSERFEAEQQSSAAAAALSDKKLLKTNIAAAVGCSDWFGSDSIRGATDHASPPASAVAL
jgi:hypothetical protein